MSKIQNICEDRTYFENKIIYIHMNNYFFENLLKNYENYSKLDLFTVKRNIKISKIFKL